MQLQCFFYGGFVALIDLSGVHELYRLHEALYVEVFGPEHRQVHIKHHLSDPSYRYDCHTMILPKVLVQKHLYDQKVCPEHCMY